MHRQTRCTLLLTLVVLFMLPLRPAHAQLAVLDVANLAQTTITAIQTIFIVANQILELTGLDGITIGDSFDADMDALGAVIEEARGLSYDVGSIEGQVNALFHLDAAPNNATELRQRLADIRRVVFDSYVYAMRAQTLLRTTLSAVRHLKNLVAAIGDYIGNNQGNMSLAQMESTLAATLARLQVQSAAFDRAQSVERLQEPLIIESIQRIEIEILADHPR